MVQQVAQRYTGSRIKRSEDRRILTGGGTYVDDINLPNMVPRGLPAESVRARPDHQHRHQRHARGTGRAGRLHRPGDGGPAHAGAIRLRRNAQGDHPCPTCLATDKVRLVGDPVALVVAETRHRAEDAAELIEVEYDDLPAVTTHGASPRPADPPIFEDLGRTSSPTRRTHLRRRRRRLRQADRVVRAEYASTATRTCRWSVGGSWPLRPRTDTAHGPLRHPESPRRPDGPRDPARHGPREHPGPRRGRRRLVRPQDSARSRGRRLSPRRPGLLGRPIKYIEDRDEHLTRPGTPERRVTIRRRGGDLDEETSSACKVKIVEPTPGPTPAWRDAAQLVGSMIRGAYKIGALSVRVHRRRHQQGDLRRLPRTVGQRDVRAGADHRPGGPRTGQGAARDSPAQRGDPG